MITKGCHLKCKWIYCEKCDHTHKGEILNWSIKGIRWDGEISISEIYQSWSFVPVEVHMKQIIQTAYYHYRILHDPPAQNLSA